MELDYSNKTRNFTSYAQFKCLPSSEPVWIVWRYLLSSVSSDWGLGQTQLWLLWWMTCIGSWTEMIHLSAIFYTIDNGILLDGPAKIGIGQHHFAVAPMFRGGQIIERGAGGFLFGASAVPSHLWCSLTSAGDLELVSLLQRWHPHSLIFFIRQRGCEGSEAEDGLDES